MIQDAWVDLKRVRCHMNLEGQGPAGHNPGRVAPGSAGTTAGRDRAEPGSIRSWIRPARSPASCASYQTRTMKTWERAAAGTEQPHPPLSDGNLV